MISSVGSIIPNKVWKNVPNQQPHWDWSLIYPLWWVLFAKVCKVGEPISMISHRYIDSDRVTWFRVHFLKAKLANISVITVAYGRYVLTTSWGIILDLWLLLMGKKWKWTIASLLTFIQLLCISFDFGPWYVDEQRDSMSLLGMGGDAKNHIFSYKTSGQIEKILSYWKSERTKKHLLGNRGGRIITLKQIIVWMIFHASGQIKKT